MGGCRIRGSYRLSRLACVFLLCWLTSPSLARLRRKLRPLALTLMPSFGVAPAPGRCVCASRARRISSARVRLSFIEFARGLFFAPRRLAVEALHGGGEHVALLARSGVLDDGAGALRGRLAANLAALARGDVAGAVAPLAHMLAQFRELLVGEGAKARMMRGLDERDLVGVEHPPFMPKAATHLSLP